MNAFGNTMAIVVFSLLIIVALTREAADNRPDGTLGAPCRPPATCDANMQCERGRFIIDPDFVCLPSPPTRTTN